MSFVKRYALITMPVEIRNLPYDDATKAAVFAALVQSIMGALIDDEANLPDEVLGKPIFNAAGDECIIDGGFNVTAYNQAAFDETVAQSLRDAGLDSFVSALEVNAVISNQKLLTTTDTTPKINPVTGVAYVLHWFVGTDARGNSVLWTRKTQTVGDSRAACRAYISANWS